MVDLTQAESEPAGTQGVENIEDDDDVPGTPPPIVIGDEDAGMFSTDTAGPVLSFGGTEYRESDGVFIVNVHTQPTVHPMDHRRAKRRRGGDPSAKLGVGWIVRINTEECEVCAFGGLLIRVVVLCDTCEAWRTDTTSKEHILI